MSRILIVLLSLVFSTTVSAKTIIVLGDSISASYGIEVGDGWVSIIQKKLQAQKFPHKVFNESISGDTSAGGVARIDGALARHKPDIVLLELGANDGLRGLSPKQMKANLSEIIQRSRKAGARVLLLGMRLPPNYGKRFIDMFYNVYPQLADEMEVAYVPFLLEDVALEKDLMQRDGLHPNAKAQPEIAEKVWDYLLPLLE
ncbi:MAG: arylesterase [Gammaproteobacteria bacterium]